MKATRVLAIGLMLGVGAVACDSGSKSDDDKSSEKDEDDGDDDKKKKKKRKKKDDDAEEAKEAKQDEDAEDKPASDNPKPESTGKNAAAPEPAEPAPEPAPAQTCGGPKDIPDIPSERSDAPANLDEWKQGCSVNTVGPNSEAPDCTVTVLREWLKVTCTGDVKGYELMDGFGVKGQDYFEMFTADKMISFVIRMRKGRSQKVRICREKERASLFVSWPPSKDKPTIIALQRGPKCDKKAWGH